MQHELGGDWRAAVADDELRRAFTDPDFADDGWGPIAVPGHWRSSSDFHETDGPLLYRLRFEHPIPAEPERTWLTFDGLFYQGDVWLDGTYLGDTEGYFQPHTFDISEPITSRTEHTLAVEVACARQTDVTAKRNLTGVFQHWDCLDSEWNPGGIWRPVRLESTGPVRIRDLRVRCRDATPERAVVVFDANLETLDSRTVTVKSTVGAVDHELTQTLATGENHVQWVVAIDQPELWWPWSLGDQPLQDVTVEAWVDDELSHRRQVRTGLRRVELHNWICSVNGERLFLKGSNHGPTQLDLANVTPEHLATDVELAKRAGLDFLRVHAHITRNEFYDAADEAGLLLWQDLPLQRGYARGIRKQAVRQARYAVQVLGHHPSIAVWCGHNEPVPLTAPMTGQVLPTWNKSILDRSIKRALEQADTTRPVVAHSGVLPHPPQLDGTDSHLYFGWYWGEERDLPRLCATVPRLVRFVSEFGAQAVPDDAAFCNPSQWPDLDWDELRGRYCLQKEGFDRYVPPSQHETFDEWRVATQQYQATVIKHHVETLRRIKYRPTGGFAQFLLADCMPAVTWSVLDHSRAPKRGYAALAAACQPVIVVADRLDDELRAGAPLELDVHVVSDLRSPLVGCRVVATLGWDGGQRVWTFGGNVGADECVLVGHIATEVPAAPGRLSLDLVLDGPVHATNAYDAHVR